MKKINVEGSHFFFKKSILIRNNLFQFDVPKVMGIINVTPDSFYSESRFNSKNEILKIAEKHIREGASFLDIGAYSTRPNAKNITAKEELSRLLPAIELVRKKFPQIFISADTFRSEVAKNALESGADLINDISGGQLDEQIFEVVAKYNCPYILMHSRGNPQTMQNMTDYKAIFCDVARFFSSQVQVAKEVGVRDIILDPGFGFAKTLEQNYKLLNNLEDFHFLGFPILVGVSRKSMIYKLLETSVKDSINGTTALNTIALLKGASILRVHDVQEAVECVKLIYSLQ
jgi:dihydropteroate synthase